MCGIAGTLQPHLTSDEWRSLLANMSETLIHRGPDAGDIWFDASAGIGLAHRRLSIIDFLRESADAFGMWPVCGDL